MNLRKKILVPLAGALALAGISSVFAVNGVTQTVTAGSLTASIADVTLTSKAYSHSAQTSTGTMTLTVDDSRGAGTGWNVTVLSSAFSSGGNSIAASNFSLTSAATPVATAGQAVDVTGGPKVPTTSPVGTLDSARKVVQANANFGQGTYTQALGISLNIPGQTKAGTYVGTMTVTAADAP